MQLSSAGHLSHQTSPNDRVSTDVICSLILYKIDYCNVALHGAPTDNIQKLQRFQNSEARIVLQASRQFHAKLLLHQLQCLLVQHRIIYKLAVQTYKVWSMSTPVYLHIRIRSQTLRSSAIPLLVQPFTRTDFSSHDFRFSAPYVWNSLPNSSDQRLCLF